MHTRPWPFSSLGKHARHQFILVLIVHDSDLERLGNRGLPLLETKRAATRDLTGNEQDGDDSPDGSEKHHHASEDEKDTGTETEEKIRNETVA